MSPRVGTATEDGAPVGPRIPEKSIACQPGGPPKDTSARRGACGPPGRPPPLARRREADKETPPPPPRRRAGVPDTHYDLRPT